MNPRLSAPPLRSRVPPRPAFATCALDFHAGPFDAAPGLERFLGAEWCRCRGCGALLTRATAEHRRPAAA